MDKLSPIGYVRGEDIGVSQIEHFDDVRPYIMTINGFLGWLADEYGIKIVPMPYDDQEIRRVVPRLHELLHEYFEIDEETLKAERLIERVHRARDKQEYPRCTNCEEVLIIKHGAAWVPGTLTQTNYFGGYVCSEACDAHLCLATLAEMSDLDRAAHIGKALAQVKKNWNYE